MAVETIPSASGDSNQERDRALVLRLRSDEPGALDLVLQVYWLPLVTYASSVLRSRAAGEDIAQESVLRLWRARRQLQPNTKLRAYLYRIARNLAFNEINHRTVRIRSQSAVEQEWATPATPVEELDQKELRLAVQTAVDALPERRREVFVLARLQGLSYREIADVMGISIQTVANQMSAAFEQLRERLADFEDR